MLTDAQIERRRGRVGGTAMRLLFSDRPNDAFADVLGLTVFTENERSEIGSEFEPAILSRVIRVIESDDATHNATVFWRGEGYSATPDGLVYDREHGAATVQIKMHAGYLHDLYIKTKGVETLAPFTGSVPVAEEAQARWEMYVCGTQEAFLGVLLGGNNLRVYRFESDAEAEVAMTSKADELLWQVKINEPPEYNDDDAFRVWLKERRRDASDALLPMPEGLEDEIERIQKLKAEIKSQEQVLGLMNGNAKMLLLGHKGFEGDKYKVQFDAAGAFRVTEKKVKK